MARWPVILVVLLSGSKREIVAAKKQILRYARFGIFYKKQKYNKGFLASTVYLFPVQMHDFFGFKKGVGKIVGDVHRTVFQSSHLFEFVF